MLDISTGLLYNVKRPTPEVRTYSVDFANLATAVTSVTSITIVPISSVGTTGLLTAGTGTALGTVVTFTLSGGNDGEIYRVQLVVVDSLGNIIEESVMIKVKLTGNA